MIACGAKHTLLLDTRGNIWYWGNKLAVGIKDDKNSDQKFPKILLSETEGPFTYISTNHYSNLAVTSTGSMISFGGNNPSEVFKEHEDDDKLQIANSGCHCRRIVSMSSSTLSAVYIN